MNFPPSLIFPNTSSFEGWRRNRHESDTMYDVSSGDLGSDSNHDGRKLSIGRSPTDPKVKELMTKIEQMFHKFDCQMELGVARDQEGHITIRNHFASKAQAYRPSLETPWEEISNRILEMRYCNQINAKIGELGGSRVVGAWVEKPDQIVLGKVEVGCDAAWLREGNLQDIQSLIDRKKVGDQVMVFYSDRISPIEVVKNYKEKVEQRALQDVALQKDENRNENIQTVVSDWGQVRTQLRVFGDRGGPSVVPKRGAKTPAKGLWI